MNLPRHPTEENLNRLSSQRFFQRKPSSNVTTDQVPVSSITEAGRNVAGSNSSSCFEGAQDGLQEQISSAGFETGPGSQQNFDQSFRSQIAGSYEGYGKEDPYCEDDCLSPLARNDQTCNRGSLFFN